MPRKSEVDPEKLKQYRESETKRARGRDTTRVPKGEKTFVDLIQEAPPALRQRLVESLFDKASGLRFWGGEKKRPGAKLPGETHRRCKLIDLDTGEEVEGWIYEREPDSACAKILIENALGRPGARKQETKETAIYIRHYVKGRRTIGPAYDGEPEDDPVELPDTAVKFADDPTGEDAIGIGAALVPDDPRDDQIGVIV